MSFFGRLRASLGKVREAFSAVQRLGSPSRPLTPEFWDELEETLILADFGVPTTQKIVTGLQTVAKQEAWKTTDRAVARFQKDVERFLTLPDAELHRTPKPAVMLIVGVNGSGKTTTIGKLATRLRREGSSVLLVAGDTFRAAAAEQLAIWAARSGSELIRGAEGADGTTGQIAVSQAKLFNATAELTGLIVTKLDSTAKGGVLVAIVDELEVPVKFVGLGESPDDLRPFVAGEFVAAIFDDTPEGQPAGIRA